MIRESIFEYLMGHDQAFRQAVIGKAATVATSLMGAATTFGDELLDSDPIRISRNAANHQRQAGVVKKRLPAAKKLDTSNNTKSHKQAALDFLKARGARGATGKEIIEALNKKGHVTTTSNIYPALNRLKADEEIKTKKAEGGSIYIAK